MQDPGLTRHEWETEWAALESELETAPVETLPELADLVARMLQEYGLPVDGDVAAEGVDAELGASYRDAREVADRASRGDDVDPGDVGDAINRLRELHDHLLAELLE
jgi:hypothetical protein